MGHLPHDQVRELANQIRDLQNSLMRDACRRDLTELAAHELTQALGHGKTMRDADVIRVRLCVPCAERARAFRRAFLEFGIDVAPWELDDDAAG